MDEQEQQLGFELGVAEAGGEADQLAEVREDIGQLLEIAHAATADGPWDTRTLRYQKIVFLQLAKLLPDEEGEQLRFEFLEECERIEALLAA